LCKYNATFRRCKNNWLKIQKKRIIYFTIIVTSWAVWGNFDAKF
jgi:hypothetical protein